MFLGNDYKLMGDSDNNRLYRNLTGHHILII